MPASSNNAAKSHVDLDLDEISIRLRFALPSNWIHHRLPMPPGAKPDAQGRLTPRLVAKSPDGRCTCNVSASRMTIAALASAVAYWAQCLRLTTVPNDHQQWGEWPAYAGWSKLIDVPDQLAAVAWLQAGDVIVELRLQGPSQCRDLLEHAWTTIRESFGCAAYAEPREAIPAPQAWWSRVKELRAAGQLDEAINLVQREGDRAEALLIEAELHWERMRNALGMDQLELAREAWRQATTCAHTYAASASSGGEGDARSRERDRILQALGPEPATQ